MSEQEPDGRVMEAARFLCRVAEREKFGDPFPWQEAKRHAELLMAQAAALARATSADEFATKAIELFEEYADWFGVSNEDFPESRPQAKQCEFEEKFRALICELRGHNIGPDQCGKPEHDICYWCGQGRVELGIPDWRETEVRP